MLQAMYDDPTTPMACANQFGAISLSQAYAIAQISRHALDHKKPYSVLDLGVGDGTFLKKLTQLIPDASLTGIDVSKQKITIAKKKLSFKAIEANVMEASRHIPQKSQNLVLAHFINALIPLHKLFKEAHALTQDEGYFSFITTTYESFPTAQNFLVHFINKNSLLSRFVGHYYKSMVKNTVVAVDQNALFEFLKQHQFSIIEHQRIEIPIVFNNIYELTQFSIEGTWFLNSLSMRMLPKNFLIQRLQPLFNKMFTFPYQDTHTIDIILAKKKWTNDQ